LRRRAIILAPAERHCRAGCVAPRSAPELWAVTATSISLRRSECVRHFRLLWFSVAGLRTIYAVPASHWE
jgi:hypothetical protein